MKKEKFLFELIDNYLYIANIGSMIIENYFLEDCSKDTVSCADRLGQCLDFYDQLYEKSNQKNYTEEEIDTILGYLIQRLKQETIHEIHEVLKERMTSCIENAEQFLNENLFLDSEGNPQETNQVSLEAFIRKLRIEEEKMFEAENC